MSCREKKRAEKSAPEIERLPGMERDLTSVLGGFRTADCTMNIIKTISYPILQFELTGSRRGAGKPRNTEQSEGDFQFSPSY